MNLNSNVMENPIIKERLKEFIKHIGKTQEEFATELGLSKGYVGAMRKAPSLDVINKIKEIYPQLNTSWLTNGEGNMITTIEAEPINYQNNYIMNVPLVNQYAQAGYLCGYNDANYMETLPTIPFIVDHEAKGNYVAFEVKGDSMNNGTEESYLDGDRLLCREIAPHLWANSKLHIRKWDFVIVHKEGILVKRIIDHDVEHHTITIHSINDMYEDRVLDLADVYQIFNVIEFLRPRRR